MSHSKTDLSEEAAARRSFSEDERAKVAGGVEYVLNIGLGRRLAQIHDELGSDKFVQVVGKSEKQIGRYEKGDDVPFSVLERASKEVGVSLAWLAYGHVLSETDLMFEKKLIDREIRTHRAVLSKKKLPEIDRTISEVALEHWQHVLSEHRAADERLEDKRRRLTTEEPFSIDVGALTDLDQPGMIAIPRYDEVRASAGPGAVATNETPTTRVAFERHWLAEIGVQTDSAVILPAQGDSMEPTIMNGSPMLVDTSKTEVQNGYIYVIAIENDLLVKRVRRRLDGRIDLISDNRAYDPETLDAAALRQLRVIGRVYAAVSKF